MRAAASPLLSVVIPVWNGQDTIGDCLEHLFRSTYSNFEVIVVDDGSTDATAEVCARFPCTLCGTEQRGPAAARNYGAERSSGEILFFLDGDVLVKTDSLMHIVSEFDQRPDLDALFGSYGTATIPQDSVSVYKNLLHHFTHQLGERNATTFCGGFGAIRREAFQSIGGFDPDYRFLEDVEMGFRLHGAGSQIALVPELQFTHCKRYTLRGLIRSDLFGRAIPWTRLILSHRVFRNDLNTRTHNILSVPISFLVLALPVIALTVPGWRSVSASGEVAAVSLFVLLNRRFLAFLNQQKGIAFALEGAFLSWLGYLYSALGVAIGTGQHLVSVKQGRYTARVISSVRTVDEREAAESDACVRSGTGESV